MGMGRELPIVHDRSLTLAAARVMLSGWISPEDK